MLAGGSLTSACTIKLETLTFHNFLCAQLDLVRFLLCALAADIVLGDSAWLDGRWLAPARSRRKCLLQFESAGAILQGICGVAPSTIQLL